ncbi:hypothetical protein ACQJBY_013073 [Aegilops geniculata]
MGTRSFFTDSEIQSDPELSTLIEEILSLKRERRDLIGSLTPGISRWVDEISRIATSSVRANEDCKEPFGILEDVEDLGQRMLSMSHFLSCSKSNIPLYKADELVSTSSKLMKISQDFCKSTEQAMVKAVSEAAEEEEKRKEEERKEDKKKRDRMRKKEKKKQQQHKEKDEEDKKKRGMMRKKEKDKKKKKKKQQQQQQQQQQKEEEEDAHVTSDKITEKMERKEEEEEEDEEETRRQQEVRKIMAANEFLSLSSNVLARPCCYRNELAMMITEEDEQEYERVMEAERQAAMEAEEAKREAVRKAEKEKERRREMSKQRKAEKEAKRKQILQNKAPIVEKEERIVKEHADEQEAKSPAEQRIVEEHADEQEAKSPVEQRIVEEHADEQEAKSPAEQLKERMDNQLGMFAGRRRAWEYSSGSKPGQCGGFKYKTLLSPMQFTHCIPGIIPPRAAVIESSLQIYSFKITGLSGDLKWPLNVYGVVAARDTVDRNRNLLFSQSSVMYQLLTSENDCSLCLTGPSRAILAVDPVDFEVELRVHDGYDFRGDGINDRELIYVSNRYEVVPSGDDGVGERVVVEDLVQVGDADQTKMQMPRRLGRGHKTEEQEAATLDVTPSFGTEGVQGRQTSSETQTESE